MQKLRLSSLAGVWAAPPSERGGLQGGSARDLLWTRGIPCRDARSAVFHIHIPVFRTGFALFLIFVGARMLMHIWLPAPVKSPTETQAVMQESIFRPESTTGGALKYDTAFSKAVVDLTHLPRLESDLTVEINTVFGFTVVKVDPAFNYEVEGSAMFGSAQSTLSMGHPAR